MLLSIAAGARNVNMWNKLICKHNCKKFKGNLVLRSPFHQDRALNTCTTCTKLYKTSSCTYINEIERIFQKQATASLHFKNNFHSNFQKRCLSTEDLQKSEDPKHQNFLKLYLLIEKAAEILRKVFVTEWNLRKGRKWNDTQEDRNQFINDKEVESGLGFYLDHIEQKTLESEKINQWDLRLLIKCVRCLKADIPYDVYEKLEFIQERLFDNEQLTDTNYHKRWKKISILLLEIGVPFDEITELKLSNSTQPDLEFNDFICLGDKAIEEGKFKDSIEYYTKALRNFDVPYAELSKLYFKRSNAHRLLNDITSAKKDADCAIYFSGFV